MSGEIAAARAHPAVVASMVVAGVAVTAAALVAIAYMLGWLPARATVPTPVGIASPAQQVTGTANDLALLPGEIVVAAPEAPKPATPSYAKPRGETPKPAPAVAPQPAPRREPSVPVKPSFAQTAPAPPVYARPQPRPGAPPISTRNYCVNCGVVAAITAFGGGEWDVRVRFEDGSTETLRYREAPRLRIGERVRLEDGLLVRE